MATSEEWVALAARVEATTGADREIDYEVGRQIGWTLTKMKGDAKPYWRKPGETEWYMRQRSGPPAYTASVDAVLAMIETLPGWGVLLTIKPDDAWALLIPPGEPNIKGEGGWAPVPTPALALLAAYCRARAAQLTAEAHL